MHAHWRTVPAEDAPALMVLYYGAPRHCTNLCGYLERRGFRVHCGDTGASLDELRFLPDAILVRVDGPPCAERVRPEFEAVKTLGTALPGTPIAMMVDQEPSDAERDIVRERGIPLFQRGLTRYASLVDALLALVTPPVAGRLESKRTP